MHKRMSIYIITFEGLPTTFEASMNVYYNTGLSQIFTISKS